MTKIINIAIIGCSAIADKTVLPTIKSNPSFNLLMVGSRSHEKGKIFAEKYNCRFGTYEEVLQNKDVEAVYISVPSGLHFEWGKKALESGKHLLLEKPFTANIDQATTLIDLASNKKLIAMEGLAFVYHPYFEKLKALLVNKVIGDVRLFESSFGFPFLPLLDIRNQSAIGGGAILDNLIYPLSASLLLFGRDYTKKSFNIHVNEELKIDERGFVRIDWKDRSANLSYGFGFAYKNSIELWGSEGSISIDRAFTKPADMKAIIAIKTKEGDQQLEVDAANQFYLMLDDFKNKIIGRDTSGKNENLDILARMEIISEMYQSYKEKR